MFEGLNTETLNKIVPFILQPVQVIRSFNQQLLNIKPWRAR